MAQTIDFTIRTIEALRPPDHGRIEFKDLKTPGLYLRVTSNGVKTFSFVGRAKGASRPERVTFGKFPAVKPEEAKTLAQVMAGRLAGGVSVAAVARERRGEMNVGELWDLYFEYIGKTNKNPENTKVTWDTYVAPYWKAKRLSDVKPNNVERWHLDMPEQIRRRRAERAAAVSASREERRREIAARQLIRRHGPDPKVRPKPAQDSGWKVTGMISANKGLELLRALYNFALDPKRGYFTGVNPASRHKPFPAPSRERFLQPDELKPFFEALAAEPNETMRDFFLIALLTGARRANVLSMRWADVQLQRAEWKLAGEFTKNGQPQTVTLSPEAVLLLERRKAVTSSAFVFASDRSKDGKDDHIKEPKTAWKRIKERASLADLRIHDLRRTLGSWQARTGASMVLIGKSLNHKDPQSTAVYARLDLDPVRQSVDRATSAMFEAGGVKSPAKVVKLPSAKAKARAPSKRHGRETKPKRGAGGA